MAIPRKKRASTRVWGSGEKAQTMEPMTKMTALTRIAPRRPILFERTPLMRVPKTAPQRRELTTNSITASLIEKLFWMNPSAPEMTPISRPKSNPARAAVIPMK